MTFPEEISANQVLDGLDYAAIGKAGQFSGAHSDGYDGHQRHLCTDREKQRALSGQEHGLGRDKRGAATEI